MTGLVVRKRRVAAAVAATIALAVSLPDADARPARTIRIRQVKSNAIPIMVKFGKSGRLYVAFFDAETKPRAGGGKKRAIWLAEFEPNTGREVRRAAVVSDSTLLNGARGNDIDVVTSDESYFVLEGDGIDHELVLVELGSFEVVGKVGYEPLLDAPLRLLGDITDGLLLLIQRLQSVLPEPSFQILELGMIPNLDVLRATNIPTPGGGSAHLICDLDEIWINGPTLGRFISEQLRLVSARDPGARSRISIDSGFRLPDGFCTADSIALFASVEDIERQVRDAFGRVYPFRRGSTGSPVVTDVEGCGFRNGAVPSPDGSFAVADCASRSTQEWRFGGRLQSRSSRAGSAFRVDLDEVSPEQERTRIPNRDLAWRWCHSSSRRRSSKEPSQDLRDADQSTDAGSLEVGKLG